MRVAQFVHEAAEGWSTAPGGGSPSFVLVFGAREALVGTSALAELRAAWPGVPLLGASTSGEIAGETVRDGTVVATAVTLAYTAVRCVSRALPSAATSVATGRALGASLVGPGLRHVLVFSEGLRVNGSDLARGLTEAVGEVPVTGGLAGDGAAFAQTCVVVDGEARAGEVVALGLYGDRLVTGHGSLGGWDPFGPDRVVTRSDGNVLYELDGEPALALYRRYLGPHAERLPASGLLFPLMVLDANRSGGLVRTILGIDEAAGSLIFAGDVPEGSYARLMRANLDRLIDGATGAASATRSLMGETPAALALLVSCVGRKLVLGVRTDEELEVVREVVGPGCTLAGFYSYGEISPLTPGARCELHNQTMTISTFAEV
jgi:hypothetical protein